MFPISRAIWRKALPLSAVLVLASCASGPPPSPVTAWSNAGQLVLVTTAGWRPCSENTISTSPGPALDTPACISTAST